jgi:hypothetical protein
LPRIVGKISAALKAACGQEINIQGMAGRRLAGQGGGWAGGGGSEGMYAMRFDRPLVAQDLTQPAPPDRNPNPKFSVFCLG